MDRIEAFAGEHITKTVLRGQLLAAQHGRDITVVHNGIEVIVHPSSCAIDIYEIYDLKREIAQRTVPINEKSLTHLSRIIDDQQASLRDMQERVLEARRSLRDEFAIASLTTLVERGPLGRLVPVAAATAAYEFADAMLEVRIK